MRSSWRRVRRRSALWMPRRIYSRIKSGSSSFAAWRRFFIKEISLSPEPLTSFEAKLQSEESLPNQTRGIGAWLDFSGLLREAPGLFWKRSNVSDDRPGKRKAEVSAESSAHSAVFLGSSLRPHAPRQKILALATQGTGGDDEARLLSLLANFSPHVFPFHRNSKWRSLRQLVQRIFRQRPDLVVMEGTGLAGGLALLLARRLAGVPFVVSSGDAVGPFVAGLRPLLGPFFGLYECLCCR